MLANIEMSKLRKTKTNANQAVKLSVCCTAKIAGEQKAYIKV